MFRKTLITVFCLLLIPGFIFAAGYGKISGKVVDKATGEPLIGATVQIEGTVMGASTNVNGQYVILNVPAGVYSIKVSQVGYTSTTIKNVRVFSDQTTTLDVKLSEQAIQVEAIEITADRPIVQKNTTSSVSSITSEEIKNLPLRSVADLALLSTGIVYSNAANASGIVIRGGRPDEVAYYVDGVQTTNKLGGGEGTYVIANAVEEVQVLAGGYSAEYGGANSGIIKTTMKTGTSNYKVGVELRTDSWAKPGKEVLKTYSYGRNDYSAQVSGPVIPGDNKYRFFLAGQYLSSVTSPNWYPELNIKGVVDNNVNAKGGHDTLDIYWPARIAGKNDFDYQFRINGNVLLDLKPFQVRIGGTHRYINFNNGYFVGNLFNGDRITKTEGYEQTGNIKLTHFLTSTTFYNINFNLYNRYQHTYDKDYKFDWPAYGDSIAAAKYGYTMRSLGVTWTDPNVYAIWDWTFNRYGTRPGNFSKVKQSYIGATFDFTHQIGVTHEIKLGGEYSRYTFRSYAWSNGTLNQVRSNPDDTWGMIAVSQRPSYYGYDFFGNNLDEGVDGAKHPVFAAAYIQDKIEFSDIVLNIGLRYDYIDSDGWDLVDKTNVKFTSDGLIKDDQFKKTETSNTISPRIGFSFALTDKTVFYAAWGRFVQQSKLRDIYLGRPYVSRVVTGGNAYADPIGFGIKPEKTTQYDVGFKQQIGDNLGVDISAYYKDIKDQVTAGFQPSAPTASHQSYYMLENADFSTTKGIELKVNLRRTERIAAQLSYTYSDARGTGSATRYSTRFYLIWQAPTYGGEFQMPTFLMPLLFNYPHSGSMWIDYRFGENDGGPILSQLGMNLLFRFNSGRSYTRIDPVTSDYGASEGSAQHHGVPIEPYGTSKTPWAYTFDLTIDKTVKIGPVSTNFYVTIYNLLNSKNEVNVYAETGSGYDDGYLSTAKGQAAAQRNGAKYVEMYKWMNYLTAGMFNSPREVYFGVRLDF
jgi:outer membrane receptor protein involved in Fe transport